VKVVCEKYKIRSISQLDNINQRVVLLRVDFNVPIDEKYKIVDDFRIKSAAKTIDFLLERGAKVILISHLGDPKEIDESLSFKNIVPQIEDILNCKIMLSIANDIRDIASDLRKFKLEGNERNLFMLDNIRFFPGEKTNDITFAQELVKELEVDIYINDAFSVSHREQCSLAAIPSIVSERFAGFSLLNELHMLDSILGEIDKNEKKVTAIIGGKKVKSKLKLLTTLSKRVNKLIIVGGMANTFLKSQGIDIGNSFYEEDMLDIARNINNAQLPLDFIDENCEVTETLIGRAAYDIGPKSLKLIDSIISQSDIVIWNGPAGVYEDERFIIGSNEIAMSIVRHNVKAVIGGGDTVAIVNKLSLGDNIYISSGGGAFIAWLENPSLPGITHLCP